MTRDREAGVVGGIEVLPFGLLVFVVGALLFGQAWTVIDAKAAADAAAREAGRAFVESRPSTARAAGRRAAAATVRSSGRDPARMTVTFHGSPQRRCAIVVTEVRLVVSGSRLPWVGTWGTTTVRGRHRDVVDPFGSGRTGEAACAG